MNNSDFDNFYRASYASFFYYALHLLDDDEQSRDVVGEGFEMLWQHTTDWPPVDWKRNVYRFIHSRCIDLIRRRATHQRYADYLIHASTEGLNDIDDRDDRIDRILSLMDQLPEKTRFVMEQCFVERKKYQEVADMLDISSAGVKKHVVKGLRYLREKINTKES